MIFTSPKIINSEQNTQATPLSLITHQKELPLSREIDETSPESVLPGRDFRRMIVTAKDLLYRRFVEGSIGRKDARSDH